MGLFFVKTLILGDPHAKKEDDKEPDDHYDPEGELKRKMEDKMPKGYIMVSYLELPTDENLSNYAPKAMEAIKNAGGKFIARGMPVATYENGMNQRAVIVEFESTDEAQAAFTSDVYQAAFALLDGVKRDVRVIEGFE